MKNCIQIGLIFLLIGCGEVKPNSTNPAKNISKSANKNLPCVDTSNPTCSKTPCTNDPTDPLKKGERRLWADSWIWHEAPKFQIQKWLNSNAPASTKGKFILVEFWNTWCPPCRQSLKLLNHLHRKFPNDLVVIGICDESPGAIKKFLKDKPGRKIEFYCGIDRKARMKKEINVWGVPHAILIEPEKGVIIWEGFPLLAGYELKDDIIQNAINIYKKSKDSKK